MSLTAKIKEQAKELAARRKEIKARRKRINASKRGSKARAALVRYQRKVRARAEKVRKALMGNRRKLRQQQAEDREWAGSRAVTNEVIEIVGGRAPVTSRKRTETFGNPGSDHHVSQTSADAVDFGIANAYDLGREIAAKLGAPGQWTGDYDSFYVTRNGATYRVQIIAGTHGTGPHLHVGVRRA